ncbi:hypothetical protein D3C71_942270 [compost metagenome]
MASIVEEHLKSPKPTWHFHPRLRTRCARLATGRGPSVPDQCQTFVAGPRQSVERRSFRVPRYRVHLRPNPLRARRSRAHPTYRLSPSGSEVHPQRQAHGLAQSGMLSVCPVERVGFGQGVPTQFAAAAHSSKHDVPCGPRPLACRAWIKARRPHPISRHARLNFPYSQKCKAPPFPGIAPWLFLQALCCASAQASRRR